MNTINMPAPWPGTDVERRANNDSHSFIYLGDPDDGDARCMNCDCRPYSRSSDWPCGADILRVDVERGV